MEWLDFVAKTKNTIRAKNLKNISHALFAAIIVCFCFLFEAWIYISQVDPKLINVTFLQLIGNVHETLTHSGRMMVC
jgi:hypothetical protein